MKRNFIGYGKEKPKILWPQENKIAISFVVNIEEGAELSISSGDSQMSMYTKIIKLKYQTSQIFVWNLISNMV